MEIVEVTAESAYLGAWAEVKRRAELATSAYATPYTEAELRAQLRNATTSEHVTGWAGLVDGAVVATAQAELTLTEDRHIAWVDVTTDPDHWGHGYGTRMLQHTLDFAADCGRTTCIAETHAGLDVDHTTTPAGRLLARAGFAPADKEVMRVLDLPVADATLDDLAWEAAPHHDDYRIEVYDHHVPEPLQESYCTLANSLLADSPTGDITFEQGGWTPEHLRERFDSLTTQQRRMLVCVAVAPDGTCVAHNELVVPGEGQRSVFQWNTLVRHDHRGHRLGLATKVANLRTLQQRYPDRTSVRTWNSAANTPMIAINEQLGFTPVQTLVMWQRQT